MGEEREVCGEGRRGGEVCEEWREGGLQGRLQRITKDYKGLCRAALL